MKKICICGHFGEGKNFVDGQTVKTKNLFNILNEKYGVDKVSKIDTYNWKSNPFKFFFKCVNMMRKTENIIILPAHNGVKVFVPLFTILKKIYKCKIFYAVVGGWLPEYLQKLSVLNITNVDILVNFKNIKPLAEKELIFNTDKPYKLCTFSRVMQEKGIEDAINVVKRINQEHNEIVYTLEIYGPIDNDYTERFNEIRKELPEYIQYKGCIDSDKSVEVLKNYFLLLFPTRFKTEGIPGTIIDAFAAGVPVIYSNWENCDEILENKVNGLMFELDNIEDFYAKLSNINENINISEAKRKCLLSVQKYIPEVAIKSLEKEL